MKKFLYILSVLTAILLFDSCTKEEVVTCEESQDPFALEYFDENSNSRGMLDGNESGGVIDDEDGDDEMDEDNDAIVDDEDNDDEMDEDDDELIDDRSGEGNDED